MAALWMDLRLAVRNLRKGRLVTALVVLSLALAIAGNATVFGLVRAIRLRRWQFQLSPSASARSRRSFAVGG